MKKTLVILAMLGCALLLTQNLYALDFSQYIFSGQTNLATDASGEYLLNKVTDPITGAVSYVTDNGDTTLSIGDKLRGIFNMTRLEDTTGGGGTKNLGQGQVNNELSGLFEVEVKNITTGTDGLGNTVYNFFFGPSASFETATGKTGAMIAIYDDPTRDFNRVFSTTGIPGPDDKPGAVQEGLFEALATNGTHILTLGFTGAGDVPNGLGEGWAALNVPSNNVLDITLAPNGSKIGSILFALNALENNTGVQFGNVPTPFNGVLGYAQFNASGSLDGLRTSVPPDPLALVNTPFDVFDNVAVTFRPTVVPEPTTMLLLSLGAAGLAAMRRKKAA